MTTQIFGAVVGLSDTTQTSAQALTRVTQLTLQVEDFAGLVFRTDDGWWIRAQLVENEAGPVENGPWQTFNASVLQAQPESPQITVVLANSQQQFLTGDVWSLECELTGCKDAPV